MMHFMTKNTDFFSFKMMKLELKFSPYNINSNN